MSTKNDGGAAFPRAGHYPELKQVDREDLRGACATITEPQSGMSLREWFAGMALASGQCPWNSHDHGERADWAYKEADAMLRAREVK